MPSYDYRCPHCDLSFEANKGVFAPDPPCPRCGGTAAKLILSAPVVHGTSVRGRDLAARSLPECGKGCRCCP